MVEKLKIENFECHICQCKDSGRIIYMIYPALELLDDNWVQRMAEKLNSSLAVVYVPADDWNNVLTPWPEPGETKTSEPFAGKAAAFLKLLTHKLVPTIEKTLSLNENITRDLLGVSLSGLFTLWQWMLCDTFQNIASLSGSFWYSGFIEWFEKQAVPVKKGKAYFLLGEEEPLAHIKAYRSVGVNTQTIVDRLKTAGIDVQFQWVPGNHFSDPVERAERALLALC